MKAIVPKRFRPITTDSKHSNLASPNLLKELKASGVFTRGEVIVGDITYIRLTGGRFYYLAIWQDKLTRRIIGWELAESPQTGADKTRRDHSFGSRKPVCFK